MTIKNEKKIYFADINEEVDINKIEGTLEKILNENILEKPRQFQEEWDELQKISIIIQGYKSQGSENQITRAKSREEKKIRDINEEIERKKEETYFNTEKKMSEIENKIGEHYNSIYKLNECQKEYYTLERITRILDYEQGEKDVNEGKNICKGRIEELRKKVRLDYKSKNKHDAFIRERKERITEELNKKEIQNEKKIIKERIELETNEEWKNELEQSYNTINKYKRK